MVGAARPETDIGMITGVRADADSTAIDCGSVVPSVGMVGAGCIAIAYSYSMHWPYVVAATVVSAGLIAPRLM